MSKENPNKAQEDIAGWGGIPRGKDTKVEVVIDDDDLQLLLIDVSPAACVTSLTAQHGYCHVRAPDLAEILRLDLKLSNLKLIILRWREGVADEEVRRMSIEHLARTAPDMPLLVLLDGHEPREWDAMRRSRSDGNLAVGLPIGTVVEAIRQISSSDMTFSPNEHGTNARDRVPFSFTGREKEVLNFLRQGKSNKAIAHELSLCESTIKVHVHSIMKKMRAANRTEVVCLLGRSDGVGV